MSDKKLSDVIARVQKLLRLKTSSNVNEAAAAAAIADRLIQEHGLTEAQFNAEQGRADDEPFESPDAFTGWSGPVPEWALRLSVVVCKHYDCASYFVREGRKKEVRIIGRVDDVAAARFMYSWLLPEVERLTQESCVLPGTSQRIPRGRTFLNSFRHGAVKGISDALAASKAQVHARATSTALMVVGNRLARAEETKHRENPDIKGRKHMRQNNLDALAFVRGRNAGKELPQRATRNRLTTTAAPDGAFEKEPRK